MSCASPVRGATGAAILNKLAALALALPPPNTFESKSPNANLVITVEIFFALLKVVIFILYIGFDTSILVKLGQELHLF